jgi:hypothetical protein
MSINEVKIEMSNRILAFPILNDILEFDSAYQKCAEKELPSDDPQKKKFWMTAFSIKDRVLQFMIDAGLIAKVDTNRYLLTSYGIGKRKSGGYFPVGNSFVNGNLRLNFKGFEKSLIKLLRKQPTKRANISSFVNGIIDCRNEVKDEVRAYLIYLRDKGTIEIREDEENPATGWWWGDFLGHNPQAGGKVTELYVALAKDYLNKPWKDKGRNWVWVVLISALIGAAVTLSVQTIAAMMNSVNSNSTQKSTNATKAIQPPTPK